MAKQTSVVKSNKTKAPPPVVFGLGCTSTGRFTSSYREWLKRHEFPIPTFKYVTLTTQDVGKNDVYLFDTVGTFVRHKNQLPDTSVAVIADSPLLLSEVRDIAPLDYDPKESWRLVFSQPKISMLHMAREKNRKRPIKGRFANHQFDRIDRLGLVISQKSSGLIVPKLNRVTNQLDFARRETFRNLLRDFISAKMTLADFKVELMDLTKKRGGLLNDELDGAVRDLIAVLGRYGSDYITMVKMVKAGKSFKKLLPSKGDEFDVKYLAKLIKPADLQEDEQKPVAAPLKKKKAKAA